MAKGPLACTHIFFSEAFIAYREVLYIIKLYVVKASWSYTVLFLVTARIWHCANSFQ